MLSSRTRQFNLSIIVAVLLSSTLACSGFEKTHCIWWEGGEWIYSANPYSGGCCKTTTNDCSDYQQSSWDTPGPADALTAAPMPTINVSPTEGVQPQTESSPTIEDPFEIWGIWKGTAQWLCDNNPVWSTRLELRSNGSFIATFSTNTDYASADGSWVVNGNEISLQGQYGFWIGTISGNTINGTFSEPDCNGVWVVTKE